MPETPEAAARNLELPKNFKNTYANKKGLARFNLSLRMSIYVARSLYRGAFTSRPKLKIQFPHIKEFMQRRAARIAAKSASRKRRLQRPMQATLVPVSFLRKEGTLRKNSGSRFGSGLNVGGAARQIKQAVLRFEFGPSTAIGGMFMIAVLLSLLYLAHFNQVATKGYDLRRLEAARQQLLNQYDIKNMKLAEVKSLTHILDTNRVSGMRKPSEIIYVRAATALAKVDSL